MYSKAVVKKQFFSKEWCESVDKAAAHLPAVPGKSTNSQVPLRKCTVRSIGKQQPIFKQLYNELMGLVHSNMEHLDVDIYQNIMSDSFQHITYNPNDYLKMHIDTSTIYDSKDPKVNTKLSVVVLLSPRDEYIGGEFVFGGQLANSTQSDVLDSQGTVAMFTSYTPHEVRPVVSGQRRVLFFWIPGPQWR